MNKRSFSNLMSLEKRVFEESVAKFEKLNRTSEELARAKRVASNDDDPLPHKRSGSPDLLVEMQQEDSEMIVEMLDDDSNTAVETPTDYGDVITLLKRILDKQDRLEARMIKLETTINDLVTSTEQNKRNKAEDMARDKVMRECKVLTQKVHKSICRLTGEDQNEADVDVAASFPISTVETAEDIDEKMRDTEYHHSLKLYLLRLKASGANFEGILRKLYTDAFLTHYNWEGRNGKPALMQFSLAADLLYECSDFTNRSDYDIAMRRCISKSHCRVKQRRHHNKMKMEGARSNNPEMILS